MCKDKRACKENYGRMMIESYPEDWLPIYVGGKKYEILGVVEIVLIGCMSLKNSVKINW